MSAEARRILALLNDPRRRERMMQAMNRENLDDVGPVEGFTGAVSICLHCQSSIGGVVKTTRIGASTSVPYAFSNY